MRLEEVIQRPLITEKATRQKEKANEYFFAVSPKADKRKIRQAVEKLFKVQVTDVRTINMEGKQKRVGKFIGKRANWKKAIVTLKTGETIKIFEGA